MTAHTTNHTAGPAEAPTPRDADGARLAGLQLIRALAGADFQHSRDLDAYVASATGPARDVLDYARTFVADADASRELAPLIGGLAENAVAALTALNGPDRVAEWLAIQTHTVEEAVADVEHSPDPVVLAVATRVAGRIGQADDPELDQAVHADVLRLITEWVRPERAARDRFDLTLSAAWQAAYLVATALGHDQRRITEYLDETSYKYLARHAPVPHPAGSATPGAGRTVSGGGHAERARDGHEHGKEPR